MPTGKNKVPMAELRQKLAIAGLDNVKTYIQTGNIIVDTQLAPMQLKKTVVNTIRDNFGCELAVVVLTPSKLKDALSNNPFKDSEPSCLYFTFFASKPNSNKLHDLLASDFGPDRVEVVNGVLYTLYATKLSDSKWHNNAYERRLSVISTTRNLNTTSRLLELSQEA